MLLLVYGDCSSYYIKITYYHQCLQNKGTFVKVQMMLGFSFYLEIMNCGMKEMIDLA